MMQRDFKPTELARVRQRLLRWYDRSRRDLLWRRTRDAYHIWVSEIMLQQTRVQAVIPYYERFLRAFPDVRSLAAAGEQDLLARWSGLGYYSRARNLQRAAQIVVRDHEGSFPRDFAAALSLPGVGRYTASAVLSIAYGAPLAVLDGNVARVLARLHAFAGDVRTATGREKLWQRAGELLSRRRPGDFNQAMMELGATLCLPRQPRCAQCPLRLLCRAYLRGEVNRYPVRPGKPQPARRRYVAAIVRDRNGRLLLVQRPPTARWMKGFWELPMWETGGTPPVRGLALAKQLGAIRHSITGYRLEVAVYSAAVRNRKAPAGRWTSLLGLGDQPVTTITRKAVNLIRDA
jgi:A/G-specific adenine glycosylase